MRYCIKLYPDSYSKDQIKTIEIDADDAVCEELSEETQYLQFNKFIEKKTVTVYGVAFHKVIEFYAVDYLLKSEEQVKQIKPTSLNNTILKLVTNKKEDVS